MNSNRTSLFYMANLGSEMSHAISEYEKKDFKKMQDSIIRAENIIQKIKKFPKMKSRIKEIEILESIINDLGQKKFELNKKQFLDYFSPFAVRLISL